MSSELPPPVSSVPSEKEKVPILRTDIILADVVGFSMLDDQSQYVAMSVMSRFMSTVFQKVARESFDSNIDVALGWVPTGDGFYIILNPLVSGMGIFFALALRHVVMTRINQTVGFKGVRFAVHHGAAIPFEDVTGKPNFIGSGLNDCARLLNLKDDLLEVARNFHRDENTVVASQEAVSYFFMVYPRTEVQDFLDLIGWRQTARFIMMDKHGKSHSLYFVDLHRDSMLSIPKIVNRVTPSQAVAAGY